MEVENFRKDGTPFWVEFIVRPVADSTGWYRYWISVQRETTNRRKRDAIFETTRRMLDEAPIGLAMLDEEMNLTYANAQMDAFLFPRSTAPLTPISLQTWLIQSFTSSYNMGEREASDEAGSILESLLRAPHWVELIFEDRWYLFRSVRLQNGASLLIVDDVTERYQLRAELDFTMRLESMGQLAGGIAHDFNNLLAVMLGNLEVALEESDKRTRDECIEDAISSILSSREIIRQLLTFARRAPANPSELSITRFLHEFRKLALIACPDSVDLQVTCDAPDAAIYVDRAQLEGALLNLVVNAKDAMEGRGTLKISAYETAVFQAGLQMPQPMLAIDVSDTGCGIPAEHLERVIEPFFSTKPESRGTGLGLAMVHGFARSAGGDLRISSEVDIGTTAQLLLPAVTKDQNITKDAGQAPRDLPDGIRVLIVDDDPGIRRILDLFLRDLNWSVDHAESGVEAVRIIDAGPRYDLILTDLSMPGSIQGDELASYARRKDRLTKCIVLTGNPDYAREADDQFDFLLKPLRRNEFLEAVAHAFKKR